MRKSQHQSGAVSLFIVIFTALLITIIVVSFVRIMIRDQQQASDTDLSQSAYDSARAGVEDAKRALLRYQQACNNGNVAECARLGQVFEAQECDTNYKAIGVGQPTDTETIIQQSESDTSLDQAYTCVKISLDSDDYLGQVGAEESKLIPLKGAGPFNTVELSWFSYQDFSSGSVNRDIYLEADPDLPLPRVGDWKFNQPSVIGVSLMQTAGSFSLADFDNSVGAQSNAKSLALYPSQIGLGAGDDVDFATDVSRSSPVGLTAIECRDEINSGGYACTTRLKLPDPIGGDATNRVAFLRLIAHYNQSHYKIALYNDNTLVSLQGVQFLVDSTGRASDLFRRVESRIELQDATFPYPESALDLDGPLCKDFRLTDQVVDYSSNCTP